MEIEKNLNWYLSQDTKVLTPVQKEIILNMRIVKQRFNNDAKSNIDYYVSKESSYYFLHSKGYNGSFCEMIISKVYLGLNMNDYLNLIINYTSVNSNEKIKPKSKTYIFKDNSNLFKIGRSKDPFSRHDNIRKTNIGLKIIFIFDKDIESVLHAKYDNKHVSNEWFKLSGNDLADIYKKYSDIEIFLG